MPFYGVWVRCGSGFLHRSDRQTEEGGRGTEGFRKGALAPKETVDRGAMRGNIRRGDVAEGRVRGGITERELVVEGVGE